MGTVAAAVTVALDPSDARDLWFDTRRWPTFVDGFNRVARREGDWPQEGGRLTWDSKPNGRGRVWETVTERRAGEVVAAVEDDSLKGTQTATFHFTPEGTRVHVTLTYRLKRGNPVLDVLFIRRAQRDALRRTLTRYAREADLEAELS